MISSLYFRSESKAKSLRIGVLINDFQLEGVFRQVLLDIAASDFANVELVIVNREPRRIISSPSGRLARYMSRLKDTERRRVIVYDLFQKYNLRRERSPKPRERVDCTDILGDIERFDVTPVRKRFVHRFPLEAVEAVRARDLDVILRFGFNILRGEVLASARYGIWSFHHGDNEYYRGGPALFWEVIENNPCSGVILQVLTEKLDDGLVLCKSIFSTVRGLWPSQNQFQPYWGSTHLVIQKLHELHQSGWETVRRQAVPLAPYRGKTKIYRAPGNLQMLKWLVPKFGAEFVRRCNPWRAEKIDYWRICLRHSDAPQLLAGRLDEKSNFRWIPSPPGHFYADPVLFEHQGQVWLFFEDFLYGQRGRISCAPVQSNLSIGDPVVCLNPGYHVSYPLVFPHGGEIFMIPESAYHGSGTVELWRATRFPFSWKLEKTLFSGSLVDTTPVFHQGRWYFFTAISERNCRPAFAALFSSDTLTSEWVRHPDCPISTDIRSARSAGAVLKVDNRLLRPIQDCGQRYGHRIHIEEIMELSPKAYRGRRLHSIEADWEKGLSGVHTYGFCAGIEVLDAVCRLKRRHRKVTTANCVIGP